MVKKQNFRNLLVLLFLTLVVLTTRVFAMQNSFTQAKQSLSNEQLDQFILGKSFFRTPWVQAPSVTTARDGLGPLFNANTCVSCHPKNGRGKVFDANNVVDRSRVVRLSIPSNQTQSDQSIITKQGFIAEPTYGAQVSINGVSGVPFEAKVNVKYQLINVNYPDGTSVLIQKPTTALTQLGYGVLHKDAILTSRIAPALVGLGLIEQITDQQILQNEDINDVNNDGISGKANLVWSKQTQRQEIGRYTWKASVSTLKHQVANAAINDMGLTNPLHLQETCTNFQTECLKAPKGDYFEFDLPEKRLNAISFYLSNLTLPKATQPEKAGKDLFVSTGCANCHIPSYTLKSGKTIHPYSDFLLHDMGAGLADDRQEFLALGFEWRTPPLWGIKQTSKLLGKQNNFLHDGRARNVQEAILWHEGEASQAKNLFMNLSQNKRLELLKFVNNL